MRYIGYCSTSIMVFILLYIVAVSIFGDISILDESKTHNVHNFVFMVFIINLPIFIISLLKYIFNLKSEIKKLKLEYDYFCKSQQEIYENKVKEQIKIMKPELKAEIESDYLEKYNEHEEKMENLKKSLAECKEKLSLLKGTTLSHRVVHWIAEGKSELWLIKRLQEADCGRCVATQIGALIHDNAKADHESKRKYIQSKMDEFNIDYAKNAKNYLINS